MIGRVGKIVLVVGGSISSIATGIISYIYSEDKRKKKHKDFAKDFKVRK